jgi:hypothetical protein
VAFLSFGERILTSWYATPNRLLDIKHRLERRIAILQDAIQQKGNVIVHGKPASVFPTSGIP